MRFSTVLFTLFILLATSVQVLGQVAPVIHTTDQQSNSGLLGNTQTVDRPTNVSAGDLILVTLHYRRTNTTIANTDGFILVRNETSGSNGSTRSTTAVFYKIATATEPTTYTFTTTGNGASQSNWRATANRVTGHNPILPLGPRNGNNSAQFSVSNFVLPSVPTIYENSLLVSAITNRDNVNSYTYTDDLVFQQTSRTAALITYDEIAAISSTGTRTFSWSPSNQVSGVQFVINGIPCVNGNLFFTNISCNATNDGSLQVLNPTGGSGVYEYQLNNNAWQSSNLFSNLSAGNYTVRIRDANNPTCMFEIGTFPLSTAVIANDDSFNAVQNVPLYMNVVANDQCSFDPTTVSIVTPPSQGIIQVGANGQLIYLPLGSFSGQVQFVYQVCNAGSSACDQATVTINVEEILDDPCFEATKDRIFYLPFPENPTQLRQSFLSAASVDLMSGSVRSIVGISIPYPSTRIHYDHWEDGYDADIENPMQPTSQIWGDGILTNGVAPGYPTDIIPPGAYIVLDNTFTWNRPTSEIVYDAKDKIYSSANVVVSKAAGDVGLTNGGNTVLFDIQNVKINVFDVSRFGQSFVLPFGENVVNNGATVFSYVGVFVRAEENGTVVNLDYDGNGSVDVISPTLNEGEVWFYNGQGSSPGQTSDINTAIDIKSGAILTSNNNVGIDLIFGGIDSYGTRNIPVFPIDFYGSSYYSPVYSTSTTAPVVGYFVNPNPSPITINWARSAGTPTTGSFVIPGNQGIAAFDMNVATATRFRSAGGEVFTAVAVVDADNDGSSYDWAFSMIPENRLTALTSLAWAPGSSNLSANYNPVWITPAQNTTIYVKYDGNVTVGPNLSPCGGRYDVAYTLNELQTQLVFGLNNDNSGMAFFNCDNVPMSAVWGERPFGSTPVASPAIDLGYTMDPMCFSQLIIANDDNVITPLNTPINVQVITNDAPFLTVINPATVSTLGVLQPANGTVQANPNGTVTYTPNPGFIGVDQFEYRICAQTPYETVCDVALVTVTVPCANSPGQNVINGSVFNDINLNTEVEAGESGIQSVVVSLYNDINGNGSLDGTDVLVENQNTAPNGSYQFNITQDNRYLDQFNTNGSGTGSNGTINWTTSWTEIGENDGFNSGNVIVTSNALRISGNSGAIQTGARRTVGLAGSTQAILTYNFNKSSFSSSTSDWVDVQIATSTAGPWTTLIRYSGNASASGTGSFDITSWISANTVIRMVEADNANFISSEFVSFDNVQVQYYTNTNFIVVLDALPEAYTPTAPIVPFFYPISFQGVNNGSCGNNFSLAQADLEIVKTVDDATPTFGQNVVFTITVTNNGPSNTDDVIVTDLLPAGLTYVSHSTSNGSYIPGNGQWTIGQIQLNEVKELTITALPTLAALPSVTNTTSILISSQGDQDLTNNTSSAVVTPVNIIEAIDDNGGIVNGQFGGVIPGFNVLITDFYNGGQANLTNVSITQPAINGPLTVNADGTVTVAPNTLAGTYTILYTINDLLIPLNSSTAQVTVQVINTNLPPVAVNDVNTTFENTPVNGNVSTNDFDPNSSDVLTFSLLSTSGLNGTVAFNPNGTYVFTPTPGFVGETSFTYTVCDNGFPVLCDNGVVVIEVINEPTDDNNPPNAINDNLVVYSTNPINVCLLCNDFDIDGDNITVTSIINPFGHTIVLNPNGTVTVTPAPGTTPATITFQYVICDNGTPSLCDTATVTIDVIPTVGPQPPFATDDSYTTPAGVAINSSVLPNDILPETTLTYTVSLVDNVNNGTLTLNPNGTFNYVPNPGFLGNDQFIYSLCDNASPQNCDEATVYITVFSNNEPPVAVNDVNTTFENIPVPGNVSTNDIDPNLGDVLTFSLLSTSGLNGTVVFNPNGTYVFTPSSGFVGETSFTYTVCDNGFPVLCDNGTVVIEVINEPTDNNNPPNAINDNLVVYSTNPINVCLLCNDFDIDGDNITVTSIINPFGHTIVLNPNGTVTVTPAPGTIPATITFQYVICDNATPSLCDTATVTIDIIPTVGPQPPFATDDSYTTPAGVAINSSVLPNDILPETTLTYTVSLVDNVNNGTLTLNPNGTFNYVPNPGFLGNDQFIYSLCDNASPQNCDEATVYITVFSNNEPPVAVHDINTTFENTPVNGDVSTNDTDPNLGDVLTFTLLDISNLDGTIVFNPNGTYVFTPTTDFLGETSFTYTVCDNGSPVLCDEATVVIEVREEPNPFTNDPPTANDDNIVVYSDDPIIMCVLCNDYDLNGDDISVTSIVNPLGYNVVLNPNGTITVTPPVGVEDTIISFEYVICDNGTPSLCDTASVTIEVNPIPGPFEPPFATDDAYTTPSGEPITSSVITNDITPEGTLTYTISLIDNVNNGTLVLNPNGTFTYTPNPGFVGNDQFEYNLCDNATPQNCDQATAYIIVKTNDIIALDDDQTVLEINSTAGFTNLFNVLPNDSINDNPINIADVNLLQLDQLTNFLISPTTGLFSVVNMELPGGIYNITYRVCEVLDGDNCDTAVVTVKLRDKEVNLKVLLQGALFGTTTGVMRDDLRALNMIPTLNPYSGAPYSTNPRYLRPDNPPAEVVNAAVFAATGNDAIVDWVFIELRNPSNINNEVHTKAALVQRDGDIVDVDGNKALNFGVLSQTSYYVTVKHRNHLGATTALPITFVNRELTFDFTSATPAMLWDTTLIAINLNYNGYEQVLDVPSGKYALWAGNTNVDRKVKYVGTFSDQNPMFNEIINDPGNTIPAYNYNFATPRYSNADVNLDGKVKYRGSNNDAALIFFNVITKYAGLNTDALYNYNNFNEQVPN